MTKVMTTSRKVRRVFPDCQSYQTCPPTYSSSTFECVKNSWFNVAKMPFSFEYFWQNQLSVPVDEVRSFVWRVFLRYVHSNTAKCSKLSP